MDDKVLAHHGTKGMRWGIRKYQNKDGSLTPAGRKRYADDDNVSDDYKKHHTSKSVKSMSDKELRERLNRLAMEEQYNKAIETGGQRFLKKGKQAVSDVLWNAGKEMAKNIIVRYATKGIEKGIEASVSAFIKKTAK